MELIWDFDGTLFDTYPLMAENFRRAMQEEGAAVSIETLRGWMAVSMGYTIAQAKAVCGMTDAAVERYRDLMRESGPLAARPFPGAAELCARVVQQGGHNHLCTHRGVTALQYLEAQGLRRWFTVCVTDADGFPRKPAPDGILSIVEKMGVPKRDFMMLGDRELDIQAAHNAGIAACRFVSGAETPETAAEFVLHDFAAFEKTVAQQMN